MAAAGHLATSVLYVHSSHLAPHTNAPRTVTVAVVVAVVAVVVAVFVSGTTITTTTTTAAAAVAAAVARRCWPPLARPTLPVASSGEHSDDSSAMCQSR